MSQIQISQDTINKAKFSSRIAAMENWLNALCLNYDSLMSLLTLKSYSNPEQLKSISSQLKRLQESYQTIETPQYSHYIKVQKEFRDDLTLLASYNQELNRSRNQLLQAYNRNQQILTKKKQELSHTVSSITAHFNSSFYAHLAKFKNQQEMEVRTHLQSSVGQRLKSLENKRKQTIQRELRVGFQKQAVLKVELKQSKSNQFCDWKPIRIRKNLQAFKKKVNLLYSSKESQNSKELVNNLELIQWQIRTVQSQIERNQLEREWSQLWTKVSAVQSR